MKAQWIVFCSLVAGGAHMSGAADTSKAVWHLDTLSSVGGLTPEVLGAPKRFSGKGRTALCFDGKSDGLFLPVNPIEGWSRFTIEILFRPDGDGPPEQRFLHIQDDQERRALIETRLTDQRTWSLDTFLRDTDTNKLALLDRAKAQPTDQWYWAALVYDGVTMSHYVNGIRQLEGAVTFPPTGPGRISLGMRQNKVHWFKGCIAQVRFSPSALAPDELQRSRS
jgi:hypothetical protein